MILSEVPRKWLVAGVVGAAVLLAVLVGLAQEVASLLHIRLPTISINHPQVQTGKLTVVQDAAKASFDFWIPEPSNDWEFNAKSPVFDATKGVVDYQIKLADGTNVTISQQPMPDELKPWRSSAKFNQFIVNSNVTFSQGVGAGKAFYRAALENGAPANGSTTVIFATDSILMFGQAGDVLDYGKWAKLLSAMKPQSTQQ